MVLFVWPFLNVSLHKKYQHHAPAHAQMVETSVSDRLLPLRKWSSYTTDAMSRMDQHDDQL